MVSLVTIKLNQQLLQPYLQPYGPRALSHTVLRPGADFQRFIKPAPHDASLLLQHNNQPAPLCFDLLTVRDFTIQQFYKDEDGTTVEYLRINQEAFNKKRSEVLNKAKCSRESFPLQSRLYPLAVDLTIQRPQLLKNVFTTPIHFSKFFPNQSTDSLLQINRLYNQAYLQFSQSWMSSLSGYQPFDKYVKTVSESSEDYNAHHYYQQLIQTDSLDDLFGPSSHSLEMINVFCSKFNTSAAKKDNYTPSQVWVILVSTVAMQYWLLINNRFMARDVASPQWNESLPPFPFLWFERDGDLMGLDYDKNPELFEELIYDKKQSIHTLAQSLTFSLFVCVAIGRVAIKMFKSSSKSFQLLNLPRHDEEKMLTEVMTLAFHHAKEGFLKNRTKHLHSRRFIELQLYDQTEVISQVLTRRCSLQPLPTPQKLVTQTAGAYQIFCLKHITYPKAKQDEASRIPYIYAHCFFNPITPLFFLPPTVQLQSFMGERAKFSVPVFDQFRAMALQMFPYLQTNAIGHYESYIRKKTGENFFNWKERTLMERYNLLHISGSREPYTLFITSDAVHAYSSLLLYVALSRDWFQTNVNEVYPDAPWLIRNMGYDLFRHYVETGDAHDMNTMLSRWFGQLEAVNAEGQTTDVNWRSLDSITGWHYNENVIPFAFIDEERTMKPEFQPWQKKMIVKFIDAIHTAGGISVHDPEALWNAYAVLRMLITSDLVTVNSVPHVLKTLKNVLIHPTSTLQLYFKLIQAEARFLHSVSLCYKDERYTKIINERAQSWDAQFEPVFTEQDVKLMVKTAPAETEPESYNASESLRERVLEQLTITADDEAAMPQLQVNYLVDQLIRTLVVHRNEELKLAKDNVGAFYDPNSETNINHQVTFTVQQHSLKRSNITFDELCVLIAATGSQFTVDPVQQVWSYLFPSSECVYGADHFTQDRVQVEDVRTDELIRHCQAFSKNREVLMKELQQLQRVKDSCAQIMEDFRAMQKRSAHVNQADVRAPVAFRMSSEQRISLTLLKQYIKVYADTTDKREAFKEMENMVNGILETTIDEEYAAQFDLPAPVFEQPGEESVYRLATFRAFTAAKTMLLTQQPMPEVFKVVQQTVTTCREESLVIDSTLTSLVEQERINKHNQESVVKTMAVVFARLFTHVATSAEMLDRWKTELKSCLKHGDWPIDQYVQFVHHYKRIAHCMPLLSIDFGGGNESVADFAKAVMLREHMQSSMRSSFASNKRKASDVSAVPSAKRRAGL